MSTASSSCSKFGARCRQRLEQDVDSQIHLSEPLIIVWPFARSMTRFFFFFWLHSHKPPDAEGVTLLISQIIYLVEQKVPFVYVWHMLWSLTASASHLTSSIPIALPCFYRPASQLRQACSTLILLCNSTSAPCLALADFSAIRLHARHCRTPPLFPQHLSGTLYSRVRVSISTGTELLPKYRSPKISFIMLGVHINGVYNNEAWL